MGTSEEGVKCFTHAYVLKEGIVFVPSFYEGDLHMCTCLVLFCTGSIPKELGGLTRLSTLVLSNNQLTGKGGIMPICSSIIRALP